MKLETFYVVLAVAICVVLSTTTDTISTQYWKKQTWQHLVALLTLSPCVFFAFGYVGHNYGLSVASCITNSLIVVGPILVGLFYLSEWKNMTWPVYCGMGLVVIGIAIILVFSRETSA